MPPPLFIPLRTAFFDAFAAGRKSVRRYGPRWNDRTCVVGRSVIVNKGYSGPRLDGHVCDVFTRRTGNAEWKSCNGDTAGPVACIVIAIHRRESQ
jgi:hypothetical protein